MIKIDTNAAETPLAAAIEVQGVKVERERMDVGDIMISFDAFQICIERKRWSDLAASICDGRLHEQKLRMIACDTIRYAYVIEGELSSWNGSHRGMDNKAMFCALVKTQLRDDIVIFHTLDTADTASLCIYIASQLSCGGFVAGGGSVIAGVTKRKRDNLVTKESILRSMLVTIPGMSVAKSESVLKEWPSVCALLNVEESQLADTFCGNRKLGPKMAKTIKEVFSQETNSADEKM